MKKKLLFLLPVLAILLGACNPAKDPDTPSEPSEPSEPAQTIESVTVNPETAEVAVGATTALTAGVLPYSADQTVTWTTADASVATVNDTGYVKGIAAGSTTITATSAVDPTKSDTCTVTVLAEARTMTIAECLAAEDGTPILVRGIVKEINTGWSTQYNNISVTIIDESLQTLYIYRLGTNVAVGDDITVTGEMATYNGNRQVAQGGTAVINSSGNAIPGGSVTYTKMSLAEAKAAEVGTYVEVTGVVKTIDGAWDAGYGNMNVTIIDEALTELYIYRLGTQVAAKDNVTIKGKVGEYNGNKQIIEGTAVINSSGNAIPGGEAVYATMTVAEALAAEKGTLVEVTGTVSEIKYEWSDTNKNMSINLTDSTGTIYVYKLATQVALNDNITLKGKVDEYNGAKQIASGATAVVNTAGGTTPEDPETPEQTTWATPVDGSSFKFGYYQGNKSDYYYITGEMSGFYGATTTTYADSLDVTTTASGSGWVLSTTVGGATKYIELAVNGTHINYVYTDTSSHAWNFDTELGAFTYESSGTPVSIGTQGSGTFTTFSIVKNYSATDFLAHLYTADPEGTTPEEPETPDTPDTPDVIMTIAEVLASADNTSVKFKGIVKTIGIPYSDQYNNISLYLIDENLDEIYAFRVTGNYNVGDELLISGTKTTYNGDIQIAAGATAEVLSTGNKVPGSVETEEDEEVATLKYSGATTTNMTGNNDAELLGLDASIWSVISDKNGNNNHIGLNKDGSLRVYGCSKDSKTQEYLQNPNILRVSLTGGTIKSIKINYLSNYTNGRVEVNSTEVAGSNGLYDINSSSFTLTNANAENTQVRFTSIELVYTMA